MEVRDKVERLVTLLSDSTFLYVYLFRSLNFCSVPAKRYALTLQLMLKRRISTPNRSLPVVHETQRALTNTNSSISSHSATITQQYGRALDPYTSYDTPFSSQDIQMHGTPTNHSNLIPQGINPISPQYMTQIPNIGYTEAEILRGLETTETHQLPVWISDQSLGGQSFSQHGIDAFLIPPEYLPTSTQIW